MTEYGFLQMNDLYNLLYMRSYCVKQKKVTECVPGSERYEKAKNGRLMLKCKCSECGITKKKICETDGKRGSPSKGAGILDTVASTGADLFIHHGIPWLGNKAVEMGRYYGSEALNPKIQKKAIDYALDKLNPMIQNVVSQALNQFSTTIRPNRKYKTDRKDLNGAGIINKALKSGIFGSPWQVDYKKGFQLLTDPTLFKGSNLSKQQMKENVKRYKQLYKQAKENGYKGSYTKFVKEIGVASGPTFTFPGFGGRLDLFIKPLEGYLNQREVRLCLGIDIPDLTMI